MSAGNGYTPYVLRVCEVLQRHGSQLPIGDLARAVGATVANLRAELEAYADLDESPSLNPPGGAFLFVMPAAEEVGLGAEAAGAGDGAGADARAASGDDDVPRASDADVFLWPDPRRTSWASNGSTRRCSARSTPPRRIC